MKRLLICGLLFPVACTAVPDSPSLQEELADVRKELTGEVKKLRTALAALLSAQAFGGKDPVVPSMSGGPMAGVGGFRENTNDFCWVLESTEVEGKKTPVLCLYQINRRGQI